MIPMDIVVLRVLCCAIIILPVWSPAACMVFLIILMSVFICYCDAIRTQCAGHIFPVCVLCCGGTLVFVYTTFILHIVVDFVIVLQSIVCIAVVGHS